MDAHSVSMVAGILGTVVTVWMLLPQTIAIWTSWSAEGVSAETWVLFSFFFSLWIGYDLRHGNVINLVCNVLAALISAALLLALAHISGAGAWRLVLLGIGTLAIWAALIVVGLMVPTPVVAAAIVLGSLVRAPQALRSARTFRERTASDVSRATWWASLSSGVLWWVHARLLPDPLILVTSSVAIVLSTAVVAFEYGAASRRALGTESAESSQAL